MSAPAEPSGDLAALAARHGVDVTYQPEPGRVVRVPDESVVAVLAALGVDASSPGAVKDALDRHERRLASRLLPVCTVVREGEEPRLATPAGAGATIEVETEDGAVVPVSAGLPLGRHTAHARRGSHSAAAPLIVTPRRAPGLTGRSWGFMAQLYSVLSTRSWGMGDLGDLADLAAWSGRALGAGFLQINPLHAAARPAPDAPGNPGSDPSPYRPSSRRFPDPVYLRVEDVPEYAFLPPEDRRRADELAGRAAELRARVLRAAGPGEPPGMIDRDAVWALKRAALELVHRVPLSPGRRAAYCDYLAEQGQSLDDHATWCALAERHGTDWRTWPTGLRDPRGPQVARARTENLDLVDFHCWLTWLTDTQLAAAQRAAVDAGMAVGIVHDLAVGAHPEGSDAWALQDVLATGMSVGAPPDAFNARGQDWGLPPWRPDALAATGYAPYRDLLRGPLRSAGALRMDHVMGLFRLWWVPQGRPPTEGVYVRYDADAMLGVLALEAHRHGTVVIGEDLGTVGPGVRERLTDRGILGTSVLWFERAYEDGGAPLPPEAWRADCLATVTTHDLPSTAARLTGEHVALRHDLGLLTRPLAEAQAEDATEVAEWLALLGRLGLLPGGTTDEEAVVRAIHRFLLRTPAKLVGVWLPDTVGDRRPQNLPGTSDEYPNWRLPIADASGHPLTLEQLAASPRLHALAETMARGDTPSAPPRPPDPDPPRAVLLDGT
jgi:4-alpha-glucanotransferase